MNILDFIQQDDSLHTYYQRILAICQSKNYELRVRYKENGDIPNKGFFDAKLGVIGIENSLTSEEKISCIAHELAHVELFLDSNIESYLESFENYLDSLEEKVYFDHFNGQFRNTVHHCLIDSILTSQNLSNGLFYTEIQLVENECELTVTHDDYLQVDSEGYDIEIPIPVSELNINFNFKGFQRVFSSLIQIEKNLNGNNMNIGVQGDILYNLFNDFKENKISIEELIEGTKQDLFL